MSSCQCSTCDLHGDLNFCPRSLDCAHIAALSVNLDEMQNQLVLAEDSEEHAREQGDVLAKYADSLLVERDAALSKLVMVEHQRDYNRALLREERRQRAEASKGIKEMRKLLDQRDAELARMYAKKSDSRKQDDAKLDRNPT